MNKVNCLLSWVFFDKSRQKHVAPLPFKSPPWCLIEGWEPESGAKRACTVSPDVAVCSLTIRWTFRHHQKARGSNSKKCFSSRHRAGKSIIQGIIDMPWNPLYHTAGDVFMDNPALFKNNARVELQATETPSRVQVILCSLQHLCCILSSQSWWLCRGWYWTVGQFTRNISQITVHHIRGGSGIYLLNICPVFCRDNLSGDSVIILEVWIFLIYFSQQPMKG